MRSIVLFFLISISLLAASCSRGSTAQSLVVSGSSTLAPLMEIMIDRYVSSGFDGTVSLDCIGSVAGIRRFLNSQCNVVSASRPMLNDEITEAKALGKDPVGIIVAMDAVALCTGGGVSGNVTSGELKDLLTSDSWGDVRLEWPDKSIEKYYPGQDSGTFDFMAAKLFGGDPQPILSSSHLQLSEDDHILVQGILGDPWALGFFGYSYYMEKKDVLTLLSIDGSLPQDGDAYPLSRPLYLYFDAADEESLPLASDYAGFVLNSTIDGNLPAGFLSPSEAAIEKGRQTLALLNGSREKP